MGSMSGKLDDNMVDRQAARLEAQCAHASHPGGRFYEIRVKGHLNNQWSDWLEGLQVRLLDSGEMILGGYLVDQAALMGVLNRLYGLNLALLSVSEVDLKTRQ
jgi:hypothetical protein